MRISEPSASRQNLLCAAALGLLFLSAPFPRIQLVLHAMLVLALAPRPGAPLVGALWALAAGWTLEGSLRLYPHLGGTAWADLTLTLLAGWMDGRWPLEGLKGWLARLAGAGAVRGWPRSISAIGGADAGPDPNPDPGDRGGAAKLDVRIASTVSLT